MLAFSRGALNAADTPVDFAREILPVLSNKCFVCHGPDSRKKDLLRLDSFEGATRDLGGYRAINTSNPAKSEIIARINSADDSMPPEKAEKKLTPAERKLIQRWVLQGGGYTKHWAFVPPTKPTTPSQGHPIDAFVRSGFESKGVSFATEADKSTLARRLALVLTGLPPGPALLESYLKDKNKNAYERLVEEFLSDPRYGEHQARYWLDAVRYGDTHGLHLDNKRGIYPYRDWVVRALNKNLPLDQFIEWQLAGDLLPNPTMEQLVATGFVRMNPTTAEGGVIPAEFQAKNNFDRTETLGTVFLGMTMICSRCHTHKYDPIKQTEYYQLMAFFNSTAEGPLDGNKYEYAPVIKVPSNQSTWEAWEAFKAKQIKLVNQAEKLKSELDKKWAKAGRDERFQTLAKPDQHLEKLQKEASDIAKKITDAKAKFTTTLVAKELGKPRETKLLQRGEYNLPTGEALQPDVLKVMSPFPEGAPRNRLGLAKWIAGAENPLTARVVVNRFWQMHFGTGIVKSSEDFGAQGEWPTHPALLDWLATEFVRGGWNRKAMHKLIVMSATYQQVTRVSLGLLEVDPANRLFARGPRFRLPAEMIRDHALASSGLLVGRLGGESVRPYQPPGLWDDVVYENVPRFVQDHGGKLYRRSMYTYWKRSVPPPNMQAFDAPSREVCVLTRAKTNTPLAALVLMNDPTFVEASRKLAGRVLRDGGATAESRLTLLHRLVCGRRPTERELGLLSGALAELQTSFRAEPEAARRLMAVGESPHDPALDAVELAAYASLANAVLGTDEAITRN